MSNSIDFLEGADPSTAPLFATLFGFRESVKRNLAIKKFPLVLHNDAKGAVKKAYGSSSYPYGYFKITNLVVDEDSQAISQIRRHGSGTFFTALNSLVSKAYMFRVKLNIECIYMDNDPLRVLEFVSRLALVNSAKGLDFYLNLPSGRRHIECKADQKGAAIPNIEIDDPNNPFASEVSFSYEVTGVAGLYKEVAKINNDGLIDFNIGVGNAPLEQSTMKPNFKEDEVKPLRPKAPKPMPTRT